MQILLVLMKHTCCIFVAISVSDTNTPWTSVRCTARPQWVIHLQISFLVLMFQLHYYALREREVRFDAD